MGKGEVGQEDSEEKWRGIRTVLFRTLGYYSERMPGSIMMFDLWDIYQSTVLGEWEGGVRGDHFIRVELFKKPSPIFQPFFKLLEILVSQESSYFSDNSWKISQLKTVFRLEETNENVSGYGNHN